MLKSVCGGGASPHLTVSWSKVFIVPEPAVNHPVPQLGFHPPSDGVQQAMLDELIEALSLPLQLPLTEH